MLLSAVAHHLAEGNDAGAGQEHHRVEFDEVREDRGVLQRGAGVGSQETAAVGAQVLDDLQGSNGAHGNDLIRTLQGLDHHISIKILGHPLPHQQQAAHDGEGEQHAGGDAHQVHKEVAHVVSGPSGQPADKGHAGGIAAGCRDKHHKDNDQHLGEVAQTALAGVVL